jgi:ABC-2 type transport system permease protein
VIRETIIVIRKELAEIGGDWHSLYGALVQAGIILVTCGVIVPSDKPAVWLQPAQLILLYAAFPGIVAATFSADAFAGERERKTLETLLATPISEAAVFVGKIITSVVLAAMASCLAVVAGLISATIVAGKPPPVAVADVALLLAAAVAFASVTASLASHISMRVPVARTAQQMSSMVSMVTVALIGFGLQRFSVPVTWETMPNIIGEVAVFGIALAVAGAAGISRAVLFGSGRRRKAQGRDS